MSTGIDYGMGQANIDNETNIRYGVISPHSLNQDALQDIYDSGDNLTHRAAVEDAKDRIGAALLPVLEDMGVLPYVSKYAPRDEDAKRRAHAIMEVVDGVWDSVEQDWNDQYEEDNDAYLYKRDGYVIETTSLGLYVIKSPYYTHAAFCSPCCPGAGDLDTPRDGGVKTYALGPDWFEGDKAPYPVYRVDGELTVAGK